MPTLNDIVARRGALGEADVDLLHRLIADWQLLADLSFADLVLWVPDRDGSRWWAVAQMRPTTGPTVYHDDLVGRAVARGERPQLDVAHDEVRICRERDPEWLADIPVREETIPVVRPGGGVVGVVSRHTNLASARVPSRLELTYLRLAGELAQMLAEGGFPLPGLPPELDAAPRVGDGLVSLDASGDVEYASPNALSAYRRLGLTADLEGRNLARVTRELVPPSQRAEELAQVAGGQVGRSLEADGNGSVLALRSIPLVRGGRRTGAVVLVRDVTELRRLDRELLTKDATIREIHHRVKNNLQTVAALLRLQTRRLSSAEARTALEEAVRRVGAIAVVHETLSLALTEQVSFDDVADRVVAMVLDVGGSSRVTVRRRGKTGVLAAAVASPLAMVVTELLQNALEHGVQGGSGTVEIAAERTADALVLSVIDDGAGLPEGFDPGATGTLGLQIVRTLVVGELGGEFSLRPGAPGEDGRRRGAVAWLRLPLDGADRRAG